MIEEVRKAEHTFLYAQGRLRVHFLAGMFCIQQIMQDAKACDRQPAMQLPVFPLPGMQKFVCNVVNPHAKAV